MRIPMLSIGIEKRIAKRVDCGVMCIIYRFVQVTYYLVLSVYYTLYNVYSVYCIVYSVYYTVYTVVYTLLPLINFAKKVDACITRLT